ncbi:MAG: LytTR family DNA-binding domain-containing protein [Thermoanaerobaculia bacterium]
MNERLSTLIVDDEPIARRRLRRALEEDGGVEVVGECGSAEEAIEFLAGRSVDLALLDVQLPGENGFAVLSALRGRPTSVVFVTAFDHHAAHAFEVAAVDYLVKPFDGERVRGALARVRRARAAGSPVVDLAALEKLLAAGPRGKAYRSRILVRSIGRIAFVPVEEVDWFEAAGNYVRLHTARGRQLARETMAKLESELDPERFVRVHRGIIVNLDRVRGLERALSGDHTLVLESGARVTLARSHRERFERAVSGRFGEAP